VAAPNARVVTTSDHKPVQRITFFFIPLPDEKPKFSYVAAGYPLRWTLLALRRQIILVLLFSSFRRLYSTQKPLKRNAFVAPKKSPFPL
jgi:hypothetical protein